jgi:hypothetical protein
MFLGAPQHRRRIDILPPGVTNINRADFVVRSHQSDTIGETTVTGLLSAFEILKDF